jgi:ATP-dependent Clp protease ATP-binding subunit ClpA
MNYKFEISESAINFLAKEGYDEAYGARPLVESNSNLY